MLVPFSLLPHLLACRIAGFDGPNAGICAQVWSSHPAWGWKGHPRLALGLWKFVSEAAYCWGLWASVWLPFSLSSGLEVGLDSSKDPAWLLLSVSLVVEAREDPHAAEKSPGHQPRWCRRVAGPPLHQSHMVQAYGETHQDWLHQTFGSLHALGLIEGAPRAWSIRRHRLHLPGCLQA